VSWQHFAAPPAAAGIAVGFRLPTRAIQMSNVKARLFSLPKESFHTHDAMARALGLKVSVPQGLMCFGYLSQLCTEFFGPGWVRGGTFNIVFARMLQRDDLLTVGGAVAAIESEAGKAGAKVTLDIWVDNDRGERVTLGTATGMLA
jgi:hypothetical protein